MLASASTSQLYYECEVTYSTSKDFLPKWELFTNHEDFSDFTSIIVLWEKTIRRHLTH